MNTVKENIVTTSTTLDEILAQHHTTLPVAKQSIPLQASKRINKYYQHQLQWLMNKWGFDC